MSNTMGEKLKQARIMKGLTVQQVSEKMINAGYKKAHIKTIYSWECGNSKPAPDYFLELCDIYEIDDILSEFGYKKTESPSNSDELSASFELFQSLKPEKQQETINFMKFLASQQENNQ